MTWSGTVDDNHKLGDRKRAVKETITLTNGRTGTVIASYERINTIVSETWVGISGTTADAYYGSHTTDPGLESLVIEPMNEAGAYQIVKETITAGTW